MLEPFVLFAWGSMMVLDAVAAIWVFFICCVDRSGAAISPGGGAGGRVGAEEQVVEQGEQVGERGRRPGHL